MRDAVPRLLPSTYICEAVVDMVRLNPPSPPTLIKCGRPARLYGLAALCEECASLILRSEPRDWA